MGWSPGAFWDACMIEYVEAKNAWIMANTSGDEAKELRWKAKIVDEDDIK
jgi:hypothetical protein